MATSQSINLFIDANIWLSLFHFTSDDLEQFKKLKSFLGRGIRLFVPEQIKNEVLRNRENKIKDALDRFERFEIQFPAYSKHYDEYKPFSRQFEALKAQHQDWLKKIKQDISAQTLPADIVLNEVFDCIAILPATPELVQKGVTRYNIGNPPGKDKKYGDAINWETLLEAVPDGEDLYFVSADKDYASILDAKRFHPFLDQEWMDKKHSQVIFYHSLVEFFKNHVQDIRLFEEREKDRLIDALRCSRSFQRTHYIIEELSKHSGWTLRQIQDMCVAAIENNQIQRIIADMDVFEFYHSILDSNIARNSNDDSIVTVRTTLQELVDHKEPDEEIDLSWLFL